MKPALLAAVAALLLSCPGFARAATTNVLLSEVLASWQGNDRAEFIELVITVDGSGDIGGADLVIDGPTAAAADRQVFTIPQDIVGALRGTRILFATNDAADLTGFPSPDFTLPDNVLNPDGGRICYRSNDQLGNDGLVDCLSYGSYSGGTGGFGRPTRLTPDNRSLVHSDATGDNRADWTAELEPQPQNLAGRLTTLASLCGDGKVNQGEDCDGTALGGETCADLGFAKGKLKCTQCHFDTRGCTFCGNDEVNKGEECDGVALNGKSCGSIGFTGGTLLCSAECKLGTDECDPTFFVPGGGPVGPECLGEWRIRNGSQRPGGDGKASPRQRCKDGDITCDADTTPGQCTFQVAVCFNRSDDRFLKGTTACKRGPIGFWQLKSNVAQPAQDLLAAVGALAPSAVANAVVTFGPALPANEQCTATQSVVVQRGSTVTLKSRTVAEGGKPRDVDGLKLACTP